MIPTIGFMVGFYIITRMASFLTRKGDRAEAGFVKVLAVVTALVAALGMASLLSSSVSLPAADISLPEAGSYGARSAPANRSVPSFDTPSNFSPLIAARKACDAEIRRRTGGAGQLETSNKLHERPDSIEIEGVARIRQAGKSRDASVSCRVEIKDGGLGAVSVSGL